MDGEQNFVTRVQGFASETHMWFGLGNKSTLEKVGFG